MPRKRWLRIIFVAFIMYTIAFIDRTNISMALPSMIRDLHMDPAQAGDAAGIFFWGYMVLQFPGGLLAERWSAKRIVNVLLILWGLSAVASGFVRTWREFWMMRFFLGVAEGGVFPATLVLLSNWFPRAERARANALWMLCLPVAVAVSSPLSGWILGRWDWRVLLVAEGALPFFWLLVWSGLIDDHPHQARWLSKEEREQLVETLRRESEELEPDPEEGFISTLVCSHVSVMFGVYFLITAGGYGYLFWLPSLLESANKTMSSSLVGVLFAIPFAVTVIGMILNSQHSDRTHERRLHVAIPLAVGGISLLAAVLVGTRSPLLSFILICIAGASPYASLGPFWAIPTESLAPRMAGGAMGLVNAVGNLGGYFGPLAVGALKRHTGNFTYAFGLLSVGLMLGSALALLLTPARAASRVRMAVGAK